MKNIFIKIVALIAYVVMVAINFLSNSLPINGRTPGEISDAYPNLFAPAGLTFSIWGLIYLWLGMYVVYQFLHFRNNAEDADKKEIILKKVNAFFIVTSLANISWIFAWHYDYIGLSLIVMFVLLWMLIKIADTLREKNLSVLNKFFIAIPFSLYFGWITIAAIANVTVFLVSVGFTGFGLPEFIWTVAILLVGAMIGIFRMQKDKNVIYGLVLIWAYLGILIKHLSESGWNKQYPSIIGTTVVCLMVFVFFVGRLFYKRWSVKLEKDAPSNGLIV